MTIAAEAILAREAGLAYAVICTVDNLANGLETEPLSVEEYRRVRAPPAPRCCSRPCGTRRAGDPAVSARRDGALLDGEAAGLRADDGMIAALGPGVDAQPGDEVIDAAGMLLCPPLVNGHTHAAMTLFRGFGDDLPLMEWLETKIWPAEAKLEPDDVYWGTRLAAVEMIRSGTTRFFDMYWHADRRGAGGRRRRPAGRGQRRLLDRSTRRRRDDARQGARVAGAARRSGPLVTPSLGPHAIYTVSSELAALDRRARRRARGAGADPSLRDRGRGQRLRRGPRRAPGALSRPARACSARGPCSPTASGSTRPSWSWSPSAARPSSPTPPRT